MSDMTPDTVMLTYARHVLAWNAGRVVAGIESLSRALDEFGEALQRLEAEYPDEPLDADDDSEVGRE